MPNPSIRVIYKVPKIEDDFLRLPEQDKIAAHILDVAPHDAILCWFGRRCTKNFNITEEHQCQSVKLTSCRGDRKVEDYAIVFAFGWVVLAYKCGKLIVTNSACAKI